MNTLSGIENKNLNMCHNPIVTLMANMVARTPTNTSLYPFEDLLIVTLYQFVRSNSNLRNLRLNSL